MQCKQCQSSFEVVEWDRNFYKKMQVPEPTLCPSCRMQRRVSFRNNRDLYKRQCDFTQKPIIALYPPDSPYPVYDQKLWWSDQWDPMANGQDYDFSRSFFEQFKELQSKVPVINLQNRSNINSNYCNDSNDLNNCYLCFNAMESQDCYYSDTLGFSRDAMDMFWSLNCERCYECIKVHQSYNAYWCQNSHILTDCYFCEDSIGLKNCFGCIGLRQKRYCIFNEQKTKEEYEAALAEIKFNRETIAHVQKRLNELRLKVPHKNLESTNSEDCVGDYMLNSKDCIESFDAIDSENCKYIWDGIVHNSMDCFNTGFDSDYLYDCIGVYKSNNLKFSFKCGNNCADMSYCFYCHASQNLFGCISLNQKKYCILNKQYSKEEYEELLPKIIEHMKSNKEWGEFFPASLSYFGYNDTMAQEYWPLEKEEALSKGFKWNDYVMPKIQSDRQIQAKDLPPSIETVDDSILNAVIVCLGCEKPFRLIQQELKFYQTHGLPIPQYCPDCRHFRRKGKINPRKLYDRQCDNCQKPMKTSYAPERPEKVYCEACYLKEIY